ncbi:hypothetical protein A0U94_14820 (plasmid) [Gluconobacter albidus]|uniref:hypothetical protein n=1 Tax=Gluconobacter albidus TaxID=318683 RepID=UPI00098A7BE8|nr:hypothetical protein [Gluconobacter albidus]AQS92438.1 hypothetical protein A0U94_14820 [Gluconobacter albidus]
MNIKRPTNLLFANTATRNATSSPLARTRKVRTRVHSDTRKIGIFDVSAHAGLLFDLLEIISRRQKMFTFYQVETSVPMGLGTIGELWLSDLRPTCSDDELKDIGDNIIAEEYLPFLKHVREVVQVDVMAGLFSPMLAYVDGEGATKQYHWNYFSLGVGVEVAISVYGLREYAQRAGRPFEAAVAILTLAQIWSALYGASFHPQSRGCAFDFCQNRDDLVEVIRQVKLCPDSIAEIPLDARESVEKCLQVIREYRR